MLFQTDKINKIIIQHNKLVNGRYHFSANELRIFVFLLSEIKKGDEHFNLVKVPCTVLQVESQKIHYEDIRRAANSLTDKKIYIEKIDGKTGKKKFDYIPLMGICSYRDGDGYIEAKFNNEAKYLLLNLTEHFTYTELRNFLKIKSYQSYRIYWLLKQYEDFGERKIAVDDLKSMLGLDDQYNRYYNFKKRVLLKAQKELTKTDIPFDFDEIKRGRAVVEIRFIFGKKKLEPARRMKKKVLQSNEQMPIPLVDDSNEDPNLRDMMRLGLNRKEIQEVKGLLPKKQLRGITYRLIVDAPELVKQGVDMKEEALKRYHEAITV